MTPSLPGAAASRVARRCRQADHEVSRDRRHQCQVPATRRVLSPPAGAPTRSTADCDASSIRPSIARSTARARSPSPGGLSGASSSSIRSPSSAGREPWISAQPSPMARNEAESPAGGSGETPARRRRPRRRCASGASAARRDDPPQDREPPGIVTILFEGKRRAAERLSAHRTSRRSAAAESQAIGASARASDAPERSPAAAARSATVLPACTAARP